MSAVGALLKEWRVARGVSQLALAVEAGVSQRHLSFLESGRAQPGEVMLQRLSDALRLRLRDRNALLVAAGFAARFGEGSWAGPELAPVRQAARLLLEGHSPHPGFVLDAETTVLDANEAALELVGARRGQLGTLNLVDLVLAPGPVREAIVNFDEVAAFLLSRLREASIYRGQASKVHAAYARAASLVGDVVRSRRPGAATGVLLPIAFRIGGTVRRWYSTVTTFGGAQDALVDEIAIELFHPMDEAAAPLRGSPQLGRR
jgi:transcriptional regulator with XRE-family HTH domain